MNNRFTEKAQNVLNRALSAASEYGHTYIGTEHLLVGLCGERDGVAAKILEAKGITEEKVTDALIEVAGTGTPSNVSAADLTPRMKKIIEVSAYESVRRGSGYIGTEHLLLAMLAEADCVGNKIIASLGGSVSVIKNEIITFLSDKSGGMNMQSDEPQRQKSASIKGAPTLSNYGKDLTALAKAGKLDPIIGREDETERVIQILLRRQKNNPCLIGEPGVGKTAVIEGLAQRIASGNVPEMLKDKQIVTVDIPGMIAGAKYRGEFEERLKGVMSEVKKNPDIILFIDEIHTLVGAGAAEGAIDAANILKPALSRGEMQLIGATTINEYRKNIEKDAALERRFQSVMLGEPSAEEAILILKGLRERYETHHKLKISDEAIEAAVNLSKRYINDRYLPDKAIDLIDEAASKMRIESFTAPPHLRELEEKIKQISGKKDIAIKEQKFEEAAKLRDSEKEERANYEKEKSKWEQNRTDDSLTVGAEEIADIVTAWTGIPVKKLESEESRRLLNLDKVLKERIIGQDEAVEAVAKAIKRGRMGLKDPKRPLGSFIFLGPTGVGKTELTKTLADIMFGDENAMIRIDMSEYMEKHSVSKLIGSPPGYVGYEEGGHLTELIRRRPYSVVLFDEIEKAHPDVFNILLQILDDGILTDSQGRRVDFKNTIIIMTSNVGASGITSGTGKLGFSESPAADGDSAKERVMTALKETFRPEFLNRVDEIIVFNKLSSEDIKKIAALLLKTVTDRIEKLGIKISVADDVIAHIAEKGFDPVYGARPLRRAIVRLIEDTFSERILEGKFKAGDSVTALMKDGEIVFEKK